MKRMWKAFVGLFGLTVMVLGLSGPAEAQVAKSGKAAFYNPGHWQSVAYKTGEKSYGAAGEWFSLLIPKGDTKFLVFAGSNCVFFEHLLDTEKGVNIHEEVCQIQDADGDAIFTSANCKFNSWTDWCNGTLDGGTGKYSGITGTMKYAFAPDAVVIERKLPPEPHQPKTRYESSGEVNFQFEIAWKLP